MVCCLLPRSSYLMELLSELPGITGHHTQRTVSQMEATILSYWNPQISGISALKLMSVCRTSFRFMNFLSKIKNVQP